MSGIREGTSGPAGHGAYQRPRLDRLGSFRELTQAGGSAFSDLFTTDGTDGCAMTSSSSYTCYKP